MAIQPANPLEQFVLEALNKQGFDKMKEGDQKMFFPQFMTEAERRVGLVLAPRLTAESADEFQKLMLKENSTSDDWYNFWSKNVPDFMELVKKALADFAVEMNLALKT